MGLGLQGGLARALWGRGRLGAGVGRLNCLSGETLGKGTSNRTGFTHA